MDLKKTTDSALMFYLVGEAAELKNRSKLLHDGINGDSGTKIIDELNSIGETLKRALALRDELVQRVVLPE